MLAGRPAHGPLALERREESRRALGIDVVHGEPDARAPGEMRTAPEVAPEILHARPESHDVEYGDRHPRVARPGVHWRPADRFPYVLERRPERDEPVAEHERRESQHVRGLVRGPSGIVEGLGRDPPIESPHAHREGGRRERRPREVRLVRALRGEAVDRSDPGGVREHGAGVPDERSPGAAEGRRACRSREVRDALGGQADGRSGSQQADNGSDRPTAGFT